MAKDSSPPSKSAPGAHHGKRLNRVAEHVERNLGPDSHRNLLHPFGCLRVGVHHPGHGFEIGHPRLTQDVRSNNFALVLPYVGQRPDASDIAYRPQPLTYAQVRVNFDPVIIGFGPNGFQPNACNSRPPASCHEQAIATKLAVIVYTDDKLPAILPHPRDRGAEDQLDPISSQGFTEGLS